MLSQVLEINNQQQFAIVLAITLLAWIAHLFVPSRHLRFMILDSVRGSRWKAPVFVFLLVLVLRGALQPALGIPQPKVHDEFSYRLMGDTMAHFRLANPTPPAWQHFETFHTNFVPSYQSKYWPGQGIVLGLGQVLFHQPWIGIYLSTALMAGAITWALQAFVPTTWAFFGGVLCVLRLCVLGYWMNSYWGGSLCALGGALCLGSAARLVLQTVNRRDAAVLGSIFGIGCSILGFTRPFEGAMFASPIAIWLVIHLIRSAERAPLFRAAMFATAIVVTSLLFLAYYNFRSTGSAFSLPYMIYERKYDFIPIFVWGKTHAAPQYLHQQMAVFYKGWSYDFYRVLETWNGFLYSQQIRRIQLWIFFVGSVLSIPLFVGGVIAIFRSRYRIVLWCAITTFVAYSVCVYFQPHYFAAATVAVYGLIVIGLHSMWSNRSALLRCLAGAVCATALVFALVDSYHSVYADPPEATNKQLVNQWLAPVPGKNLILVEYFGSHEIHRELVFNGADFASEKILWARAMTPVEDAELCAAYPDRKFWRLQTDDKSLVLAPSSICGNQSRK